MELVGKTTSSGIFVTVIFLRRLARTILSSNKSIYLWLNYEGIHPCTRPFMHPSAHPFAHPSGASLRASMDAFMHPSIHSCIHARIHPCIHASIAVYLSLSLTLHKQCFSWHQGGCRLLHHLHLCSFRCCPHHLASEGAPQSCTSVYRRRTQHVSRLAHRHRRRAAVYSEQLL